MKSTASEPGLTQFCFLNKKGKKERVDGAKGVLRVVIFVHSLDDLQLNAGCYLNEEQETGNKYEERKKRQRSC